MKIQSLQIGMKVRHPQYGVGVIKGLSEHMAEIRFDDATRTVEPESSAIQPAEPQAAITGLEQPLASFVASIVESVMEKSGFEKPDPQPASMPQRWHKGRMILHPSDPTLQTKEVPLEVFFHKIVMMRNNLRVLEQKINGHPKLEEAERIDMQQYITRCYGSMTTFNVLFKDKGDQF